jgi:hypothetical protein
MLLNDKKVMELKRNFFFKCMLALMLSVFTCISWSGVAHNNQVLIQKDQPKVSVFKWFETDGLIS